MDTSRFDPEELIDRVGGDREFALELFGDWVNSLDIGLANLEAAIQSGDEASTCHLAHSLKGTALNLAAGSFARLAMQIEDTAEAGDMETAARQIPDLKVEAEYLRKVSAQLSNAK